MHELDYRSADGIEVSLLWSPETDSLLVVVEDSRSGESFELPAPADKALDVFRHPFAYASQSNASSAACSRSRSPASL
jgi:hypothetical protein